MCRCCSSAATRLNSVFRLTAQNPHLGIRIAATGELPAEQIPAHLRACDLLVQPFPDGVSSRRTSVMAGLANGVPVVTNLGLLSEPLWRKSGAVALAPSLRSGTHRRGGGGVVRGIAGVALLAGSKGAALYRSHVRSAAPIARLRSPG